MQMTLFCYVLLQALMLSQGHAVTVYSLNFEGKNFHIVTYRFVKTFPFNFEALAIYYLKTRTAS